MVRLGGWFRNSVAAVSLFSAASCASFDTSGATYLSPPGELVVQNGGWERVSVYLVRGPVSLRIGSVEGLSTQTFLLTPAIVGPGGSLRLMGRRRSSGEEFLSYDFDLTPGSNVRWIIESRSSLSHVVVR